MWKRYAAIAALSFACLDVQAQAAYPNKAIELVVPFAPGGTVNLTARMLAQRMSDMLGQPVIVENKPGAGGNIGAGYAAKARGDGYTLLYATMGNQVIQPLVSRNLPYSPSRDFAPIALFATVPNVLAVSADTPARTIGELVQYARQNPGTLNMGSAGIGSVNHMVGELFMYRAGVKFSHVPYKGAGPAATDLLAGQIQVLFVNLPTVQPYLKSGKIRILGVASEARVASMPDVPTFAEAGVQGAETESWSALMAPAATPPAIVGKLQETVTAITRDPAFAKLLDEQGARPLEGGGTELKALIDADSKRWQEVVRHADIQLD
ncbi:Bug family tripartite tricarboxylate transporter substrate binding protein [Bordetella genomosp. 13]|uniref:Bug family tripartite tricarboxylate transporter substrate binding protein n=1 Tax=Bordetella genomosp. 13 TaxID=463040 RepID=UPI0011A7B88A|nr:tripartite tricarboxylate transporter substrate binding protein [Bordetella genomosp. 13]